MIPVHLDELGHALRAPVRHPDVPGEVEVFDTSGYPDVLLGGLVQGSGEQDEGSELIPSLLQLLRGDDAQEVADHVERSLVGVGAYVVRAQSENQSRDF